MPSASSTTPESLRVCIFSINESCAGPNLITVRPFSNRALLCNELGAALPSRIHSPATISPNLSICSGIPIRRTGTLRDRFIDHLGGRCARRFWGSGPEARPQKAATIEESTRGRALFILTFPQLAGNGSDSTFTVNRGEGRACLDSSECLMKRTIDFRGLLVKNCGNWTINEQPITSGLSLALIGNASGKEFPGRRKLTPEAFSIRRLGGSRWRLRRTR